MIGASLQALFVLWGVATTAFITIMVMKSLVGFKEEDVVILDPAEAHIAAEQRAIVAKVETLTRWAKYFGFASLALLLTIGGIWLYRALLVFNGQANQ